MHKILLFLSLFLSSCLFGQEYHVVGNCTDQRGIALDLVKVYSKDASPKLVFTNEKGEFDLVFSNEGLVELELRFGSFIEKRIVTITIARTKLKDIKFSFQQEQTVDAQGKREDPFSIDFLPPVDWQNIPGGGIEKGLIYTTSAVSNNELTTNYNVRGGSYDENLVYVNGFNIYRLSI